MRIVLPGGTGQVGTLLARAFHADGYDVVAPSRRPDPAAPDAWRFSVEVARAWEAATLEAELPATRRVILRAAMVMSPDRCGVFEHPSWVEAARDLVARWRAAERGAGSLRTF